MFRKTDVTEPFSAFLGFSGKTAKSDPSGQKPGFDRSGIRPKTGYFENQTNLACAIDFRDLRSLTLASKWAYAVGIDSHRTKSEDQRSPGSENPRQKLAERIRTSTNGGDASVLEESRETSPLLRNPYQLPSS